MPRESKYGLGLMYWTDLHIRGKLKLLGLCLNASLTEFSTHVATPYNPRKTKRSVLQESMTWDEKASGKKPSFDDNPLNDWTMTEDGGINLNHRLRYAPNKTPGSQRY